MNHKRRKDGGWQRRRKKRVKIIILGIREWGKVDQVLSQQLATERDKFYITLFVISAVVAVLIRRTLFTCSPTLIARQTVAIFSLSHWVSNQTRYFRGLIITKALLGTGQLSPPEWGKYHHPPLTHRPTRLLYLLQIGSTLFAQLEIWKTACIDVSFNLDSNNGGQLSPNSSTASLDTEPSDGKKRFHSW